MYVDVVVFAFNRPNKIFECLKALSLDKLARKTNVTIYVDGARTIEEEPLVERTVTVIESFDGAFYKLVIKRRNENFGLAASLIDGITSCFKETDKIVVIEDDLNVAPNFLSYMNANLTKYASDKRVGSVSGFSTQIRSKDEYENYFHPRPCSWGWATWKDRWNSCDWNYKPKSFSEQVRLYLQCRLAGQDVYRMYGNHLKGRINSWAIRWTIHHIRKGWLVSYPKISKVSNEGFGDAATHCKGINPFPFQLDIESKVQFSLKSNVKLNKEELKQVNYYHSNYYKLKFKLMNWRAK